MPGGSDAQHHFARVSRMNSIVELLIAAGSGGIATHAAQTLSNWMKSRAEIRRSDQEVNAKLEEHRDRLTFDLLDAARAEMALLRTELAELRAGSSKVAHLEEAFDHIHALLHADGDAEVAAAERRAKAFLRRMRPEVGDLRNTIQAVTSAQRILDDIDPQA